MRVRPSWASSARMRRVAATPSRRGIWMSIRMTSKTPSRQMSTASMPSAAKVSSTPKICMTVLSTSWLVGLSSAARTRSAAGSGAGCEWGSAASVAGSPQAWKASGGVS